LTERRSRAMTMRHGCGTSGMPRFSRLARLTCRGAVPATATGPDAASGEGSRRGEGRRGGWQAAGKRGQRGIGGVRCRAGRDRTATRTLQRTPCASASARVAPALTSNSLTTAHHAPPSRVREQCALWSGLCNAHASARFVRACAHARERGECALRCPAVSAGEFGYRGQYPRRSRTLARDPAINSTGSLSPIPTCACIA
jgi:hypothetical protein